MSIHGRKLRKEPILNCIFRHFHRHGIVFHCDLFYRWFQRTISLIRNGLSGTVADRKPFVRKGNVEKKPRLAKLLKNWTENQSANRSDGLMNASMTFLVKMLSICMKEVGREVQQWVSAVICKTQWRLCHGVKLHSSSSSVGDLDTNEWNYARRKVLSDFHPLCNTIWTVSGCLQLHLLAWKWSQTHCWSSKSITWWTNT